MATLFNKAMIVGGQFQDSSGQPLSNGWLVFKLSHDSNVSILGISLTSPSGQQVVAGIQIKMFLDNNGNLVPNQYLWTNDVLTPSGSYYRVTAYNSQGLQVWNSPQNFFIQPYAPILDIAALVPQVP